MFAGLPGVGVGTLFYVLIAFAMPFTELFRLVRGQSSVARWLRIARQLVNAVSIILSIMVAERFMMWMLGQAGPESLHPARWLNQGLAGRAPHSFLAAPMTASLLVLASVLISVEVFRIVSAVRSRRARAVIAGDEVPTSSFPSN